MKIEFELKDFNKNQILKAYGLQSVNNTIKDNAELFFSYNCFRKMQKYVPFDTGALSTTVIVEPRTVTYIQPYARKQYYANKGKGIRGKYWDKKMVANEADSLVREIERFMKRKKESS